MRLGRVNILRAAIAALFIAAMGPGRTGRSGGFETAILSIETAKGPVNLQVEIADSEPKRAQGLMFRRGLSERAGMLFLFDKEHHVSMWMKNTYMPLDMVFIGADWRVVHIARGAEPLSTEVITSVEPASRVLEIGAGEAQKLGIAVGDRVNFKR